MPHCFGPIFCPAVFLFKKANYRCTLAPGDLQNMPPAMQRFLSPLQTAPLPSWWGSCSRTTTTTQKITQPSTPDTPKVTQRTLHKTNVSSIRNSVFRPVPGVPAGRLLRSDIRQQLHVNRNSRKRMREGHKNARAKQKPLMRTLFSGPARFFSSSVT